MKLTQVIFSFIENVKCNNILIWLGKVENKRFAKANYGS